jgi:hypothetical protein
MKKYIEFLLGKKNDALRHFCLFNNKGFTRTLSLSVYHHFQYPE